MIVADTNLIVGFLVSGEHSATADLVYARDSEWHLPILWRSEFTNALATLERTKRISAVTATDALHRGLPLFAPHEHAVDAGRVLKLALSSRCTAYDCEFISLAEQLGTVVVTWDKAVIRAFPKLAVSPAEFLK